MDFNRNRSDTGFKVEKSVGTSSEPLSYVTSIGHGCTQTNHSYLTVLIHSGHDDLDNGSTVLPQKVNLVEDDQSDILGVLPFFVPGDAVPLLRCRDDDVSFIEAFYIRCVVSS